MDNELLKSRFFTTNDKKMDTVVFPLPAPWWSRPYEYAWAAEFCKPTDTVLDAACGVCHPFKFYLAEHCKTVHAVDKDERILDMHKTADEVQKAFGEEAKLAYLEKLDWHEGINIKQADITALPYKDSMFDRIFSVSVLEHLTDADKLKALSEFRRTLKNNGQVILTLDYPDTTIDLMESLANKAGLKLADEKDAAIPNDAIRLNYLETKFLHCFRMVLVKDKDDEEPENESINKPEQKLELEPKQEKESSGKTGTKKSVEKKTKSKTNKA
jgi:SAM-dependent methyltransferase